VHPQVAKLTGFDVYRDGGSIGAFFRGVDGDDYTLFFQRDCFSTAEMTTSFALPRLHRYTATEYRSPITGVATPDWKRQEIEIAWTDARALLDVFAAWVQDPAVDCPDVYPKMVAAAMADGKARPINGEWSPPNKSLEPTREG
jgi:hypothetical protein